MYLSTCGGAWRFKQDGSNKFTMKSQTKFGSHDKNFPVSNLTRYCFISAS
jgi:hypothetical protein